jgi:protein-tyrosine phosphatase
VDLEQPVTRRLDWPDCRNARDLGGLPCTTGMTRFGAIVRSDNVSNLNAAGVQAMWDFGVSTVIDLRSESEVARFPSPFAPSDYGPVYVNLPLIDDAFAAKIGDSAPMPERYRLMIDHRQEAFAQIFSAMAGVDGPLVFHCYAGKDRTGLVAAMLLSLAGVPPAAIGADYAATDVQLAKRYEEWLAAAPPERLDAMRDELRCPPEWMLGAMEHIDSRWGGVEAYLSGAGTSAAEIVRVKSMLGSA